MTPTGDRGGGPAGGSASRGLWRVGCSTDGAAPRGGGTAIARPSGTNPPLIASFSPSAGGVGTEVTVVGLNLGETPAANAVHFNGTAATVLSESPEVIAKRLTERCEHFVLDCKSFRPPQSS